MGIGPADADVNPFLRAALPFLRDELGCAIPTLDEPGTRGPRGSCFPLDATLGVDGLPQSGTGQAALLTGKNAAELHGGHFGPWTPVGLRPVVEHESLLRRAVDAGRTAAFANAYPKGWPGRRGGRGLAGPPLAARGAGLLTRHEEALAEGAAVSSEIVNDGWRRHLGFSDLPRITPHDAGRNLAGIADAHDLTLYAHYSTDTVGHRGDMTAAVAALERVDAFLGGLRAGLAGGTLVVVASDHGNIEDVRVGHTRNPAMAVAFGAGTETVDDLTELIEVAPRMLGILGIGG